MVINRGTHRRDAGEAWATYQSNGDGKEGRPGREKQKDFKEKGEEVAARPGGQGSDGGEQLGAVCGTVPREARDEK